LPVAALLAPILAEAIAPGVIAAGGLGALGLESGLGAALGAGSGALFGELTGSGPAKGAETGAIGGALPTLGGAAGTALGVGSTIGEIAGGAIGGLAGSAITGGSPILGAVEGGVGPAIGAATGLNAPSSATVTPTATATGATSAASTGGSVGAASAAAGSQIGLDPTATGAGPSGGGVAPSGGGTSGGTGMADGLSGDPNALLDATGGSSFLSPTGSGGSGGSGGGLQSLIDRFASNPAMLLNAAPLALSLFGGGNAPYPAEKQLQTLATNAGSQGQALSSYIQSGTLPPGAQANVDAAKAAAKAGIRSTDARLGLGGSTMESQHLAQVDQQAAGQQFLLADQLLGQGMNAQQIAAGEFRGVLTAEMQRDQQLQNAILNAGRALGGGGGGASTNNYYGWQQPTTVA
jgi:hypothetical protein